jgi:hypothetical protein
MDAREDSRLFLAMLAVVRSMAGASHRIGSGSGTEAGTTTSGPRYGEWGMGDADLCRGWRVAQTFGRWKASDRRPAPPHPETACGAYRFTRNPTHVLPSVTVLHPAISAMRAVVESSFIVLRSVVRFACTPCRHPVSLSAGAPERSTKSFTRPHALTPPYTAARAPSRRSGKPKKSGRRGVGSRKIPAMRTPFPLASVLQRRDGKPLPFRLLRVLFFPTLPRSNQSCSTAWNHGKRA